MTKNNNKVLTQRITDHEKLCRIMQKQRNKLKIKLQVLKNKSHAWKKLLFHLQLSLL